MDKLGAASGGNGGGGVAGGANRTFQSIFGSAAQKNEILDDMDTRDNEDDNKEEEEDDGDDESGNSVLSERIRAIRKQECQEEADDLWDDDFPGDHSNENNNASRGPSLNGGGGGRGGGVERGRSMEDWADDDDDEEHWKDALQARVDQLELVVEQKSDAHTAAAAATVTAVGASDNATTELGAVETTAPLVCSSYGTPVDQRATLTLLPKTNLSRSISEPMATDDKTTASKLKQPSHVARASSSTRITNSSSSGKLNPPPSNVTAGSGAAAVDAEQQTQPRKRSNSRDYSTRSSAPIDAKRSSKVAAAAAPAMANSVFVRAVVARGSVAQAHQTSKATTRIPDEARGHTHSHADKRAKSDVDLAAVLALSDAELVRRHILNDVKKMSVERIVADAKRLHFLEDFHRRHTGDSVNTTTAATAAAASEVSSGGGGTQGLLRGSARQSSASPTKKRAI